MIQRYKRYIRAGESYRKSSRIRRTGSINATILHHWLQLFLIFPRSWRCEKRDERLNRWFLRSRTSDFREKWRGNTVFKKKRSLPRNLLWKLFWKIFFLSPLNECRIEEGNDLYIFFLPWNIQFNLTRYNMFGKNEYLKNEEIYLVLNRRILFDIKNKNRIITFFPPFFSPLDQTW